MRAIESSARSARRVLLLRVAAIALLTAACASPPPPSVLLVVVDTLRRDHLGVYGYERGTSPALDRLARRGLVFDHHVTHASQTVPSTVSLLTSRLPADHGFVHRRLGQFMEKRPHYPENLVFLAEAFEHAGYATAGFISNPFLTRHTGFTQGFATSRHWPGDRSAEGEEITQHALEWLRERDSERPFFLYIHYMDVHQPYVQPDAFTARFAPETDEPPVESYGRGEGLARADLVSTIAHYDAGIAYVDAQIGRLIDALDAAGIGDTTIVAVTSDHGEEFLEHGGLGHATTVYGELVLAPLVLVYPPLLEPGRLIAHTTQHVDVAPTLLELAGFDRPPEFRGGRLFDPPERVYAENGSHRAVYGDGYKLVLDRATGAVQLFDVRDTLDASPLGETDERALAKRQLRQDLDTYLRLEDRREASKGGSSSGIEPWSESDLERLRVLGYRAPAVD